MKDISNSREQDIRGFRQRIEQMEQEIQAMLEGNNLDSAGQSAPLLRVAEQLRDLPRENFKARLKAELEGKSHDEPGLAPLKTGAARMALEAMTSGSAPDLAIVPIGLVFERKEAPRSRVLVQVGSDSLGDPFQRRPRRDRTMSGSHLVLVVA